MQVYGTSRLVVWIWHLTLGSWSPFKINATELYPSDPGCRRRLNKGQKNVWAQQLQGSFGKGELLTILKQKCFNVTKFEQRSRSLLNLRKVVLHPSDHKLNLLSTAIFVWLIFSHICCRFLKKMPECHPEQTFVKIFFYLAKLSKMVDNLFSKLGSNKWLCCCCFSFKKSNKT